MYTKRLLGLALAAALVNPAEAKDIRIGMVGLDTSHVIAFTRVLNDEADKNHVAGARMIAAVKDSSPDVESSYTRVEKYTAELTGKWGVKLYPTVTELCRHVDAVMIENVDGRPHLKHAIDVIKAGKPLFIDKPLAGTLADCLKIYRLGKRHKVPVFSSSSLRFAKATLAARAGTHRAAEGLAKRLLRKKSLQGRRAEVLRLLADVHRVPHLRRHRRLPCRPAGGGSTGAGRGRAGRHDPVLLGTFRRAHRWVKIK